jgi:hypothetical protein
VAAVVLYVRARNASDVIKSIAVESAHPKTAGKLDSSSLIVIGWNVLFAKAATALNTQRNLLQVKSVAVEVEDNQC